MTPPSTPKPPKKPNEPYVLFPSLIYWTSFILVACYQKWLALMENRGPSKTLPREMIPQNGSKPPLYHYGIPFTDRYMLEYAKRHHLTMKLLPEARKFFGGKAEFPFADISREDEEDEVFFNQLLSAGCFAAVRHIQKRCDVTLFIARPFSLHWDGMVSLWSNYNITERCLKVVKTRERRLNIEAKLKEAMYEGGEENEMALVVRVEQRCCGSCLFRQGLAGTLLTICLREYLRASRRWDWPIVSDAVVLHVCFDRSSHRAPRRTRCANSPPLQTVHLSPVPSSSSRHEEHLERKVWASFQLLTTPAT